MRGDGYVIIFVDTARNNRRNESIVTLDRRVREDGRGAVESLLETAFDYVLKILST